MRGELLPHLFTLTLAGGLFSVALSVTPVARRAQGLPGSLPHGARTFLETVAVGNYFATIRLILL